MLARRSLAHWAASQTSARDLPQLARFLSHTLRARRASDLPVARALSRAYISALNARRSYATAAATKPTATVKKAVKAQAQSSARPKRAAASKTTSKTAKKPAKKAAAKKTKPKPKPKAKKKPAPKKKPSRKKVLTPEEKLKADIRELRKTALKAPNSMHQITAHNTFVAESLKNKPATESTTEALKRAAQHFKELTPAEREHYNHLANEQTAARIAEYKAWINTHTPMQIAKANNARRQLRRKLPKQKTGYPAHTAQLKDDRLPKRFASAYVIFVGERWASGDLKGIGAIDATQMIVKEWKALSAAEKKKYQDAAAANLEEYRREVAAAYPSA